MLEIANDLLIARPRSSAARRRAVSTAYYAAFHALAKICTSELVGSGATDRTIFKKTYRALTHGAIKTARDRPGPIKEVVEFREIFDLMNELQEGREDADYAPPGSNFMQLAAAREHVVRSSEIIDRLSRLDSAERKTLAISLLVKDTQERRHG